MMKQTMKLAYFGVPLLLALAVSAGCAQDVGDINRTQPNAIKKSDMDGRWHYQRTVVDVPAADGFTFVGNTDHGGMSEIKWDIQQNYIYARRQTELIVNADNKEEKGEDYRGEAIAVYRIQSHFDIQRQYNPSTGEQTNVIVENASDRPWYERDYMRVDWSQNLVTNYDLDFERAATESVPYYVQDEYDPETGELVPNPDAPVFDYEEKDGEELLTYFDITNRIYARAGTIYFPGYGEIPLCWLRGAEFSECGAGEYSIRNSFKRIDPDHQYVPQPYKGKETEVFGFFTTERDVYDYKNGIRQQFKKRYLNRHNLWKKWYDEDGNLIPVAERELRPIVYFANREMPEDIKPMTQKVADQWNGVFNDVVEAAGYPLDRAGGERTFIMCNNNPVREGDPEACGEVGNSPRLGDIRYSFMAYVPKFMQYGLLGLGPSNNDPETGEIISGMAYVYHWNNTAAERTTEMVELLNGNLDRNEFIDGVNLTQWANEVNNPETAAPRTFDISPDEKFVQQIANRYQGELTPVTAADVELQKKEGFDAFIQPRLDRMYHSGKLNGERSAPEGKLRQLTGTYIEDLLVNDEILMATGHQRGTPVTDADMNAASIARGGFAKFEQMRAKLRHEFAEQRNMYLPEMTDDALMGLARELQDVPSDEVYDIIRTSIYTSVFAHEVGHSLGLMHNFAGSEDAINYFDDYWKVRDDGNVGPRINDPITQDEIDNKIYNYGYSSIMDYAGRYTIDGLGVGKYDRAAMLYGYAGKVEVFKDRGGVLPGIFEEWFEQRADILSFGQFGPSTFHYTKFYNEMGADLYEADNRMLVNVSDLKRDNNELIDWSTAEVDGTEYSRVPYVYCSHTSYNLGDSCLTRDYGADSYERMKNMLDDLNTWYIRRNFPRGSVGRSNWSYVASTYNRVYDRLKNWNDLYGLYAELLPTVYSPGTVEDFLTRPGTGWAGKTWAVKNAFNHLLQTILMPNITQYEELEMDDGSTLLTQAERFVDKEIGITQGRYYSSSWGDGNRECGYFWWECFHHIGYYLDKIMAIEALTDTSTNFVARSTPEDIREWEVGYANTFPNQILDLNSAIVGQSWGKFAPYLDGDDVMFPDYTNPTPATHAQPVDPYATFTIQLYWQVLSQARFPTAYGRNFVDESRVFILGTGHAPDLDQGRLVTITDPWTGYTYGAGMMEHGSTAENGGGESMIEHANTLLRRSNMCDEDSSTTTTDDDCVSGLSRGQKIKATNGLQDYIELIKVVADLAPKMQYGNPYAP